MWVYNARMSIFSQFVVSLFSKLQDFSCAHAIEMARPPLEYIRILYSIQIRVVISFHSCFVSMYMWLGCFLFQLIKLLIISIAQPFMYWIPQSSTNIISLSIQIRSKCVKGHCIVQFLVHIVMNYSNSL